MIKEANELIYDYFSRYDRERVEKYCKIRQVSNYHPVGKSLVVLEFDYQKPVISKETSFTDDLGADSLQMVEFIMLCEKNIGNRFQMKISRILKPLRTFMTFLSIIGSRNEIMTKHFTFYEVRCFFCVFAILKNWLTL